MVNNILIEVLSSTPKKHMDKKHILCNYWNYYKLL